MRLFLFLLLSFVASQLDITIAQAQSRDALPSETISAAVAFDVEYCHRLDLSACDDLIVQMQGRQRQTARAYVARAEARTALNDLPGAKSDAAKAISLDPQNPALLQFQAEVEQIADDPNYGLMFTCNLETDLARRIDACMRLVASPARSPRQRLDDYLARGRAYFAAGNFSAAGADIDKALQGNPQNIEYIKAKIVVALGLGDYQTALTETNDEIAKLPKPRLDFSLMKGQLTYLLGYHAAAIEDVLASMRVDAKNSEPVYWFMIFRSEDHEDVTNDLLRFNEQLDGRDYQVKMARFLLGKMTAQSLISAADGPPYLRERRLCQGYFIIGHQAWLTGDISAAKTAFKNALQTNAYDMIEYHAAKKLLGKISGS